MNLFLVVFDPDTTDIEGQLGQLLVEAFSISKNASLVAARVDNATIIRTLLGFGEGTLGVVFKLNGSYSGYYYSGLIDFLDKVKEASLEPA